MNNRKHNKKRNIGIIYELLLRHISNEFVNNNRKNIKKATNIIERRFGKQTEIYKEFRLFSGLSRSNVTSTEVAAIILSESKNHIKNINLKKLEKEKSDLIREINYSIVPNDNSFYYRSIKNYPEYANIQNAINEWKKGDKSNFSKLIKIEEKVIKHLLEEKKEITPEDEIQTISENQSNNLVYKILAEKINDKYKSMPSEQKDLIKEYAFNQGNTKRISMLLKQYKNKSLVEIQNFEKTNNNNYLSRQISEVKRNIENLSTDEINDNSIVKYLTVINLIKELKSQGD